MTPGVLAINGQEASIGPDGWQSVDETLEMRLAMLYPPPSTEAGTPWVMAFWRAVREMKAEVKQEPEPDKYPPEGEDDEDER